MGSLATPDLWDSICPLTPRKKFKFLSSLQVMSLNPSSREAWHFEENLRNSPSVSTQGIAMKRKNSVAISSGDGPGQLPGDVEAGTAGRPQGTHLGGTQRRTRYYTEAPGV